MIKSKNFLFNNLPAFSVFLLVLPQAKNQFIPGVPFSSIEKLIITCIILISILLYKKNPKYSFYIFFLILILKISSILLPNQAWDVCYQDDLAERTFRHSYIDNKNICEKGYIIGSDIFSESVDQINYFSDSKFENQGANNSNFNLGFFNSKKFNHRGEGSPDRRWLPFEATFFGKIGKNVEEINITYIGELKVYENGVKIHDGKNYLSDETLNFKAVPNANYTFKYIFNKNPNVLIVETRQVDYPNERYAKLIVNDISNEKDKPLRVENYHLLIGLILTLLFLINLPLIFNTKTYSRRFIKSLNIYLKTKIQTSLIFLVFIFIILKPEVEEAFPVFQVVSTYSLFIYLIFFYFLFFLDHNKVELFLIILFSTFALYDLDYKLVETYIRPGGSDSLTYESLARLVLEGDFLKGGEDVFYYSPGVRYMIYFSHIIFGEKLRFFFILLNALSIFFAIEKNYNKTSVQKIFVVITFIYLTSNAINRIFLFGMSEIFALLLILIYLKYNKKKTSYQILSGITLSLALLNRPVLILGIIMMLLIKPSFIKIITFLSISSLPLLHNLYFGNQPVIFTKTWNTDRTLIVDEYNLNNFIDNVFYTLSLNIDFIFMNPFEVNVFDRVGRLLPMIFFGAIMIFIIFNLKNFIFNSLEKNETLLFISVLLFCAPFAIYDPSFFYPRFLLIPHVIFLIFNSSLSNELNIESLKVKKS